MKAQNWMKVLNEQSEWRSDNDMLKWFGQIVNTAKPELSQPALQAFANTLCQMRSLVYANHFGADLDLSWLNQELDQLKLEFVPAIDSAPGFPLLRAKSRPTSPEADGLLESLRGALLLQFAADLSESLAEGRDICVQRCEGLYRDTNASKLSTVPEISDQLEIPWRQEISVLVERSLESESEIQRCADLFESGSRSKFCSDACRFSTFQIVKQLKDPKYLAEKQRRYRQKKN